MEVTSRAALNFCSARFRSLMMKGTWHQRGAAIPNPPGVQLIPFHDTSPQHSCMQQDVQWGCWVLLAPRRSHGEVEIGRCFSKVSLALGKIRRTRHHKAVSIMPENDTKKDVEMIVFWPKHVVLFIPIHFQLHCVSFLASIGKHASQSDSVADVHENLQIPSLPWRHWMKGIRAPNNLNFYEAAVGSCTLQLSSRFAVAVAAH